MLHQLYDILTNGSRFYRKDIIQFHTEQQEKFHWCIDRLRAFLLILWRTVIGGGTSKGENEGQIKSVATLSRCLRPPISAFIIHLFSFHYKGHTFPVYLYIWYFSKKITAKYFYIFLLIMQVLFFKRSPLVPLVRIILRQITKYYSLKYYVSFFK